jgi:hypothetical protein
VDALFSLVVETSISVGDGRVLDGVEIEDRGAYFEVSGSTSDAPSTSAPGVAEKEGKEEAGEGSSVEALSGPIRRLRERRVLEEGPPSALHQQIVMLDPEQADQPISIEIHGPATTVEKIAATIPESVKVADAWWLDHKGLIKPSISEIATKVVGIFGADIAQPSDVETLVDLALPSLQEVASKRQSQFIDFGVDAAVVALGNLLHSELAKRLR